MRRCAGSSKGSWCWFSGYSGEEEREEREDPWVSAGVLPRDDPTDSETAEPCLDWGAEENPKLAERSRPEGDRRTRCRLRCVSPDSAEESDASAESLERFRPLFAKARRLFRLFGRNGNGESLADKEGSRCDPSDRCDRLRTLSREEALLSDTWVLGRRNCNNACAAASWDSETLVMEYPLWDPRISRSDSIDLLTDVSRDPVGVQKRGEDPPCWAGGGSSSMKSSSMSYSPMLSGVLRPLDVVCPKSMKSAAE